MTRPANSYLRFTAVIALYAMAILALDMISNNWGIPTIIVIPIVLVGQLLYILTVPRRHLRVLSMALLVLSILATPVLFGVLSLSLEGCCGARPASGIAQLAVKSSFLVPIFGIAQFIFFKKESVSK